MSSSCLKHAFDVFVCVVNVLLYLSLGYLMVSDCKGFSCVQQTIVLSLKCLFTNYLICAAGLCLVHPFIFVYMRLEWLFSVEV